MFFSSKKKNQKADPKVRFQNRQFVQKLDKARHFKRTPRAVPETRFDEILSGIYLGSRWSQILAGLAILGILYLLYIPNFVTVENIKVSGVPESEERLVEASIRQSLSEAPFYNPQHNLIFLNAGRVREAAMKVPSVFLVEEIKKDLQSRTVFVKAIPKYERFLVSDNTGVYALYNDGTFKEQVTMSPDQWQESANPKLIKLKIAANLDIAGGNNYISESLRAEMETAAKAISGITGSSLRHFLIETAAPVGLGEQGEDMEQSGILPQVNLQIPVNAGELSVVMQKGTDRSRTFKVIFDAKSDLIDSAKRLNLLLSQTSLERYDKLDYIDMRLENRGYICLMNTKCDDR
jgi:hypothetical protein